ncbi:MAG: radical SAM protein [Bacteroidota bacterium]
MSSPAIQQGRKEIVWEQTKSICPQCRILVDARILLRNGKVFIRRVCPEHGQFEALFFGDAELYVKIAPYNKPGTLPLRFSTEVRNGCPHDCGLCPDHQQHACMAIIEVNQACNLDCPLCFADAGTRYAQTGFELTYEQVELMIDSYRASEGTPEVLQLSGGEPSLHPRIIDFIKLANRKGIEYVVLNTNGIRIARDDRFLDALSETGAHINLQFDGLDARTNQILRGKPDLADIKLKALDRLAKTNLRAVLVAAIERDVNEHEVGRIVEFGLRHPAVFGVNFQPAFRAQRHPAADPMERITIPDVLLRLEEQTKGLLRLDDFVPVPCCMPTCSFVTYAFIEGDTVTPITRILDIKTYLDYVKNRTLPAINDDLLRTLERLWSSSAKVGSDEAARDVASILGGNHGSEQHASSATRAEERCSSCHAHLPLGSHTPRDLGRHIFMINTRDFMDPWTFNTKNAMKCCVDVLAPDGRIIPFCTYNTLGYREQVRESLRMQAAD